MPRAAITPLTLYQIDDTIFSGITLPSRPFTDRGYTDLFLTGWDMSMDTLVNNLLMETAELDVIYTDPDFFKWAIKQWSDKNHHVWQAMYESMFFRYNPIWNKDGTKKSTASHTETPGITETEQKTYNLTDTENHMRRNGGTITVVTDRDQTETGGEMVAGSDSSENKVAAFDSNTYQNREKTDNTNSSQTDRDNDIAEDITETTSDATTTSNEGTDTRTGTETTTRGKTGSSTISDSVEDIETGNIGVTSSQELIERERQISLFNIYDFIIADFVENFCVMVY